VLFEGTLDVYQTNPGEHSTTRSTQAQMSMRCKNTLLGIYAAYENNRPKKKQGYLHTAELLNRDLSIEEQPIHWIRKPNTNRRAGIVFLLGKSAELLMQFYYYKKTMLK